MTQLKKPTTYQEQLSLLKRRNVIVRDEDTCISILESVNYYRLAAYLLPFKRKDDTYCPSTDFQQIYRIYEFDRKLRVILFSALEEVEIYLRSELAYFHAHKYGEEGYMDAANFSSAHQAEKFYSNLKREIENNRKSAIVRHHEAHYGGHYPIWVIVELFTFGMLSRFYSDMITSDRKQLARELYGTTPDNISSWLRCCTDLRNICAHYGRLYYRKFPATPANVGLQAPQINQLFGAVLALCGLYPDASKWNSEILSQMLALFEEYDGDISLSHIGFPADWADHLRK